MPIPWIRIQSALLAAVMTTALAVHLLLRRPSRRIYQDYAVVALNLALWFLADAIHALFGFGTAALDVLRLLIACAIPVTVTRFLRTFLEDDTPAGRRLERTLLISAVALGGGSVVTRLWVDVPFMLAVGLMMGHTFGGTLASFQLIARRLKTTESASERGRLQSLLVAGLIAVCLTLLDYLPGVGYFFFGNIFVTLFLYFLYCSGRAHVTGS